MESNCFVLNGKQCTTYCDGEPKILLFQTVDEHDVAGLDHQVELIKTSLETPFLLAAIKIEDWNKELSPWSAPAVFGPEPFRAGAPETLRFITEELLSSVISKYSLSGLFPIILGGYSLAGLFSLWSSYQTDIFSAVAAVSPSVWFPGWVNYAETHLCRTDHVYLSLGDREEKTKNRVMAAVGKCIRNQQKLLSDQDIPNTLEWNSGNHFKDPEVRCAKGFIWCMNTVLGKSII